MGKIVTLDNLEHFYGKLRDFIASEHELSESVINQSISLKQDKLVSGANIKTINGASILGSGDIISNAYQLVNHGTSDMIFTLTPNTLHIWDNVSALLLTMGDEIDGVANEYIFQFISGSKPTTLILPDSVTFNSDFTIEENKMYQISILNKLGTVMSWDINKNISDDSTDYHSEYFIIEALEDGLTVRLNTNAAEVESLEDDLTAQSNTNECEYRIDNGRWNTLSANSSTLSINKGQTLSFRGNLIPSLPDDSGMGGIGTFTISKKCNLKGNIMSLLYGDDFVDKDDLTGKDYAFANLFGECTNIVKAHDLILPATTLAEGCYLYMFGFCTSLVTAPELPATTLAMGCYSGMFFCCTSLVAVPELPATTLTPYCYNSMFMGCSNLTIIPKILPATTLAESCYGNMFGEFFGEDGPGCTSLTTAPELPATELTPYCYQCMFQGCTSLATAPELPATTLADYCYGGMFQNCNSLTTAPELPATILTDSCYSDMFRGCSSLTTAPELPATTLAEGCYSYMFWDCSSLTTAPELPATTLAYDCYNSMFYGCSKLNYITMLATDISAYNCLYDWVYNVASSGTFVKHPDMTSLPTGESGIPDGWTVEDVNIHSIEYFTIEALEDGLTAQLSTNACEYRIDDGDWITLSAGSDTPSINTGQTLSFKGNLMPNSSNGIGAFTINKRCNLKGNIMSLLYGDNFIGRNNLTGEDYTFYNLFRNCTNIVDTSQLILPATTLAPYCYSNMFEGCTSLTTTPELPATTLANSCYSDMFAYCTNLTTAPELPATTLTEGCYSSMFSGCSELNYITMLATDISALGCLSGWVSGVASNGTFVKHPDMTSLLTGASGIPNGWVIEDESTHYFTIEALEDGLTVRLNINASEPALPASEDGSTTQLSTNECEYRIDNGDWNTLSADSDTPSINKGQTLSFRGNLIPSLPDPDDFSNGGGIGTFTISKKCNLKGNIMSLLYGDNFIGQNDLTGKDFAFKGLFFECTNIVDASKLILPATTLAMGCYQSMFSCCSSLTTTPELPATELAGNCYYDMFSECTSLTTAPELPATILAGWCYSGTFWGCSSLTTAPELPATTLAEGCYSYMFEDCSSLTTAPELPAITLTDYCYEGMFSNCSNLNYITMLATDISASGCLGGWVYGVASTGTFVKHPDMTSLPYGENGIPEGWTGDGISGEPEGGRPS